LANANSALAGKKILLGVTGSIAAYKSVVLLRLLQQQGAEVRVLATPAALKFVGSLTFQTLSRQPVFADLWEENGDTWTQHVQLGKWADLLLVAPASINTLAKMANGMCDNALLAVYLSAQCPVWVAPAADREMYAHPTTQANLARLQAMGHRILSPENGYLASGLEGPGRLMEPEAIVAELKLAFRNDALGFAACAPPEFIPDRAQATPLGVPLLAGKRVLINAGPTREAIDPVRYLSNHSTGKMGLALAEAAHALGASVQLVLGPTQLPVPEGVSVIRVQTAAEMARATWAAAPNADLIFAAAAVSDYTPVAPAEQKIKKSDADAAGLHLELVRTPDIVAELGRTKRPDQVLVGFALETHDEEIHARGKLARKQMDLIVLNSLREPQAGFGHDTNRVHVFDATGLVWASTTQPKRAIAEQLLMLAAQRLA
jgi:phosphopantothenoylcysteine decarboxylase/phosphopantothenate--cysteine ligase